MVENIRVLSESHVGVVCCVVAHRLNELNQNLIDYQDCARLSGTLDDDSINDILHKAKESKLLAEAVLTFALAITDPEVKGQMMEMAQYSLDTSNYIINAYQKVCSNVSSQTLN